MWEHKVVVGCLVLNKAEEFILVKEDNGKLNFPCGGLEDELMPNGAKRETKEETGLRVALDFLIGIYHNPNRNGKNVVKVIYAAHPVGGKLDDHMDAHYVSRREFSRIPNRKLRDIAVRMAVNDYFKGKEYSINVIQKYSLRTPK
jgi:ADP-ribose pyrophosphatase YjhB (NUDIX family)